ncbi:hypothetical protein [Sulfitobacter sp. R18_1]|uniref:hypothetical protein n=1 Tax=Sulfitobacter sp. R18_1 TaxID=2821104 RepID=UPI001ADAC8F8|nr:hypothetical protein [Sulfitobacter sp. R18_1]MBO9428238.1 hypothetical protein [Sulfitobacter sp. R18_1]
MKKETAAKISLEDGTEVEISEAELDAFFREEMTSLEEHGQRLMKDLHSNPMLLAMLGNFGVSEDEIKDAVTNTFGATGPKM